ncbi:MAG: cell wall hydrolase [Bacillota bacterium]|nr:cell wall hydrolase [Bacillota bacterium]
MRRARFALLFVLLVFLAGFIGDCYLVPQVKWLLYARAEPDAAANVDLIARLIAAEAQGEPYEGMVGVGAVVMNRTYDPNFPGTIPGVIYEPWAFESVAIGLIWQRTPTWTERRAAIDAVSGWDPTYGSKFFWNPAKPVGGWIWTRPIVRQIGNHVFAL